MTATKYTPDVNAQNKHLIQAGKTTMQALSAAMRKLLQICFCVVKNHLEYMTQVIKV